MTLESPTVSDQDSLIEQEPLQTGEPKNPGNSSYATFTRKRPTNLPNSLKKKKRQSLMSPQSIPTLDSDDIGTPDFAMTQSMYEPLEKRKQQAKLESNSRLLRLIASEKASQAANERKVKEIKRKSIDQRRKNEEKQRLAEERRLRMLADQEMKKRKILDKINIPGTMAVSCYGNMSKSVIKPKNSLGSGFMEKRPLSSTGKIFGFGSSAPREVCEKLDCKKLKERNNRQDFQKSEESLSRMCASQIITKSNYGGDKFKKTTKENSSKPISASSFNISHFNKVLIRNRKASNTIKTENTVSRIRLQKPITSEIKSPRIRSNANEILKPSPINESVEPVKKTRGRSAEKNKSSNTNINVEIRSRTTERRKPPAIHVTEAPIHTVSNHKSISKAEAVKKINSHSEPASFAKKSVLIERNSKISIPVIPDAPESDTEKKPEVKFEEKENTKDDLNTLSNSSVSIERRQPSTSNLTEEEYKQRIALQRKLAKEKRQKEQEEKELLLEQEINRQKSEANKKLASESLEIKSDSTESSKINVVIDEQKNRSQENMKTEEKSEIINTIAHPELVKESETKSISESHPSLSIPKIETSNDSLEMTASTEALDRIERKKRLDSIMSRIKKPISGSTENVTHHISTTTLQDMLNKGHLSGMSKTAAILMRSAHSNSEFSASATDLNNSAEPSPSYLTNGNPKSPDTTENSDKTEESRGSCDGQEDTKIHNSSEDLLTTKSNLMGNLVSNSNKSYFSSWKDKYSDTCSLDTEDENAV